MIRICLTILWLLTTSGLMAQIKAAAQAAPAKDPQQTRQKGLTAPALPKPVIRLLSGQGFTISSGSKNGLQSFFIDLALHGRADKDQSLHLRIHSFDAPLTTPVLTPAAQTILIPKNYFSRSGLDTLATIVCTVELRSWDKLPEKEKAFIVQEGDEDNPFTLVINSAAASKKAPGSIPDKVGATQETIGPAAGSDNLTTGASGGDVGNPPTPADNAKKLTVTLMNSDTSYNPIITKDDVNRIYSVKLHFHANGTPGKDTIQVPLEIDTLDAKAVHPKLQTSTVTIQPDDWTHKDDKDNIEKIVKFQMSSVSTFEHDVSFFIRQKGDAANPAEVRITTIGLYNPNKPFWVEIGANFDFADGLKPNNFFGGVFLNKRDIRPIFTGKKLRPDKPRRLGLFAGVFESKTISDVSTDAFSVQKYYNDRSTRLTRHDSVGAFIDTGVIKTTQVVKNIGLFFSPQVRLTNGSANADGLHVAASAWLELQWQTISTTIDYTGMLPSDTTYVPHSALDSTIKRRKFGSSQDIRSHYFGLGLPIYFKEGDANVFFNPVIGLSNQPSSQDLKNFTDSTHRHYQLFYIFQFRLNEEHFGIAFTGEVRGLIVPNSKPLVSLALTKKFDLSKFLQFK